MRPGPCLEGFSFVSFPSLSHVEKAGSEPSAAVRGITKVVVGFGL